MVCLDENGTAGTQSQPCMRLQTKLEHPGTFLSVTVIYYYEVSKKYVLVVLIHMVWHIG